MIFTKQDIEQLHKKLAQLSVKDSQFEKASGIRPEALIPFVQNSKNVQTTIAEFASYILSGIDASAISVSVNGIEASTVSDALEWLYNNRGGGGGNDKTAAGIPYTVDGSIDTTSAIGITQTGLTNVAIALNAIISAIYNIKGTIVTATESDITQLFNEID